MTLVQKNVKNPLTFIKSHDKIYMVFNKFQNIFLGGIIMTPERAIELLREDIQWYRSDTPEGEEAEKEVQEWNAAEELAILALEKMSSANHG